MSVHRIPSTRAAGFSLRETLVPEGAAGVRVVPAPFTTHVSRGLKPAAQVACRMIHPPIRAASASDRLGTHPQSEPRDRWGNAPTTRAAGFSLRETLVPKGAAIFRAAGFSLRGAPNVGMFRIPIYVRGGRRRLPRDETSIGARYPCRIRPDRSPLAPRPVPGLKGRNRIAQGNALGIGTFRSAHALKGQNIASVPLSNSSYSVIMVPGGTSLFRPFRA